MSSEHSGDVQQTHSKDVPSAPSISENNTISSSQTNLYAGAVHLAKHNNLAHQAHNNNNQLTMNHSSAQINGDKKLLALLYSEFDNIVGPTIVYQTPSGFVSPEVWAAVCDFFILERDFCRKLSILTIMDYKFYGFPMVLEHEKYHRHAFFFNIAFVFHKDTNADVYEPVLAKLASALETLETESEFLFDNSTRTNKLGPLLEQIFRELSENNECKDVIANEANRINLKLFPTLCAPPEPLDHEVPVLMLDVNKAGKGGWDLAILEVLPFINGVNFLKRIADLSGINIDIVRKAIWILRYFGCVAMVDVFKFTNVYVPTRKIHELYKDKELQKQAVAFIRLSNETPAPPFSLIFRFYSLLERGLRMKEFCVKHQLLEKNINPHSFVVFGLVNKFIARVHKYPISRPRHIDANQQELEAAVAPSSSAVPAVVDRTARDGISYMNGTHSYDELCLLFHKSYNEVDSDIRASPDCVIISR